jgi:hypothetical protein
VIALVWKELFDCWWGINEVGRVKVKVKVILEQATKILRGSRGITILFL